MSETGPIPDTATCFDCGTPVVWLWSPRVNGGAGGWVMFTRESADGLTVRSHRCRAPRGEFSYQGGEVAP